MARLDLLHEETEIKSFSDVQDIEGQINDFKLKLQTIRDLLTREFLNE